jgi:hypothetical protein
VGVSGGFLAVLARLAARARERRASHVPDPMGAAPPAAVPGPATGLVASPGSLVAPLGGISCAAFTVRLLARPGSRWPRMLLSYGRGAGFALEGPDHPPVRVEDGPLVLVGPPAAPEGPRAVHEARVQALLAGLFTGTAVRPADLEIMFPWLWAEESVLLPGDRVRLAGNGGGCPVVLALGSEAPTSLPGTGPGPRSAGWGRAP